ncbi:MAG: Hsp70 family protein, partial [Clostridia bacterium]|nr:Hsp70 family protein [Clostridia bacterium]
STNMSKEDVEKAVQDAEKFAEEDKKRREEVEIRNNADQMIYQCEKSMNDMGDKLNDADKAPVNEQIETLKQAVKGNDTETIKKETEELQQRFYKIAEKIYAQQQPQGNVAPDGAAADGAAADGNVTVDDFKVDDND